MKFVHMSAFLLVNFLSGCQRPQAHLVQPAHQEETARVLERYRTYRLEPARLPPPSLQREGTSTLGEVEGRVRLVLAEDAAWNDWPDGTARLFNNSAAHLFEVTLDGHGHDLCWIPPATTLELNVAGNTFKAAPTQEALLEELVFWGFQQERAVIDGDLADRARAAGDLRRAYLPTSCGPELTGLIAFPLVETDTNRAHLDGLSPEQLHVVSMRLTLGLEVDDRLDLMVWLLD